MIRKRIFDGQLDECQLTMADLYRIEESFEATLTNIYHGRVEYPELEDDSKVEETGASSPPPESDAEARVEAT